VPDYKLTVVDTGSETESLSWKEYHAEVPLEYGNEITIEAEDGSRTLQARVVEVDNDAFFTKKATVEPIAES
jgi:hypothetical protein